MKTNVKNFKQLIEECSLLELQKLLYLQELLARLFSLQINENKKYLTLSDKNRLRRMEITSC